MTREIIKVVDVVNKVSQQNNKPYVTVNGNMNVFETNLMQTLQAGIGKTYEMEIVESNGYINIRKIYGEVNAVPGQSDERLAQPQAMPQAQNYMPGNQANNYQAQPLTPAPAPAPKVRAPVAKVEMLVSYAKDLMVNGFKAQESIDAIKLCYNEFSNL